MNNESTTDIPSLCATVQAQAERIAALEDALRGWAVAYRRGTTPVLDMNLTHTRALLTQETPQVGVKSPT